ncbi:Glycosyl hydrolases family 2, TIM barrel domain, putative [Verrucomicrobiia bacterium DG1235]|nr:Glycosyl hydrolases family 2, TIM barrel domain, putative [Verrucomicrobiae bacterium DG1235]
MPVVVHDGLLLVEGEVFDIKGICWNPIPKGLKHPQGLPYLADGPAYNLDFIERDLRLIAEAGFNTLRPYKVITDEKVLDLIESYELKVIIPVFNDHHIGIDEVKASVAALKDHPTSLFWEIGNEWNYNNLYNPEGSFEQSIARIQEVITTIRSTDNQLPLAINYGELPTREIEKSLDVDLWGLNIYRSDDFRDVFEEWKKVSDKPMYLGEYGADAIDNRNGDGLYAPQDQAYAVAKLTQQIISQYASQGRGQTLGGALFEFSDEWWKDYRGLPTEHDIGGIAPGGGPYPDLEFNEEWWGIVDIDRNPRAAYHAMKKLYNP